MMLHSQILCYNKDVKEIYYDVELQPEEPVVSASEPSGVPEASAAAPVASVPIMAAVR
ncbi:hypothetical protein BGX38DRAFT_1176554 [Terfezia claveryi]|nr:hypothetical protein BGX38DRAFT_1176554 [Terfezia claveryi]